MKIAKRGFVSKSTYQLNDTSYHFLRKHEKKRKKKKNAYLIPDEYRDPKMKYDLQFLSRREVNL